MTTTTHTTTTPGTLPPGTVLPQGTILFSESLTAYKVETPTGGIAWVPYRDVHGVPAAAEPLVTLGW